MEKRIVRTVAKGVSITPIAYLAQSILLLTVIVIGGGSILPYFFCALTVDAKALFMNARALLLAMTAPMTATMALTAAITVASIIAVSCVGILIVPLAFFRSYQFRTPRR